MDAGNLLEKVSDHLSVRRAFGPAYERDGMLIIPVALVAGGGGAGSAASKSSKTAKVTPDPAPPDSGGGFGGVVLPAGVYVVKGDQVKWVPAVDTTIVVLASLALVRLLTRRRKLPTAGRRR